MTTQYEYRHGRKIEVYELDTSHLKPSKSRSKQFEAEWIKLPMHWVKALRRTRGVKTYELALTILAERFKRQQSGVLEVTLSTEVTNMPRNTKVKAAKDLARLGLITLLTDGNQALRVIPHLSKRVKNQ
jgi:hypothetical protein